MLKLWVEKYWYDFWKDCPQLGEETLAWLKSIMNDPAAGGGPDKTPDTLAGTAKVACTLHDKICQLMTNPTLYKRNQVVQACISSLNPN